MIIHEVPLWCAVGLADWYAVSSADNYRRIIVEESPKDHRRNNKLECVNVFAPTFCTLHVGVPTSCRFGVDLVPTSVKHCKKMFHRRRWKCGNAWMRKYVIFRIDYDFFTYILYIFWLIISYRNCLIIRGLSIVCIKMCIFIVFGVRKMCIFAPENNIKICK